jgi:cellulose biosynthesis protein BcsQ
MDPLNTKFVSVFSGKGGVGKSLLTILLADYLSSAEVKITDQEKRNFRILLVDMDDQCSIASHLLSEEMVTLMDQKKLSLPNVVSRLTKLQSVEKWLPPIIKRREVIHSDSKMKKLGEVDVIHSSNQTSLIDFLSSSSPEESLLIAQNLKSFLCRKYDFVFIDLPSSNIPNHYSLIGLILAEHFIIPTCCSALEVFSFPRTFQLLKDVKKQKGDDFLHEIHGLVLNMVDKRSKTWKTRREEIESIALSNNLNKTYSTHLNFNNSLMNASLYGGESLKEKFSTVAVKTRLLAVQILHDLGFRLQ